MRIETGETTYHRVVVLGGKPAEILDFVEIGFPRPRSPDDPAIFDYHQRLWKLT
jgi:ABC-type nitrate/sulfonate/bicarbonate transport system ATPase subunit